MKEAILIVDARQPIDQAVIVADDLMPDVIDPAVLAEKAVRPEIDLLAPQLESAGQPADAVACLEDLDLDASFY